MLYDAALYDFTRPHGSFWETTVPTPGADYAPLAHRLHCDTAIIGGGLTGLSAALHLAEAGQQVCLLEAGTPGWGASGRNGGFCCVGSTWLSNQELLNRFGREETHRFFQHQRDGVELVRHLAHSHGLPIEAQGDGEIQVAHRPSRWAELEAQAAFFSEVADYPCALWSSQQLEEKAFRSTASYGALWMGVGFGLNPMKYVQGLATLVGRQGVAIYGRSPVEAWEKVSGVNHLHTPAGTVLARRVLIATNGYTPETLYPALRGALLPALSNILTTRPLTPTELEAQGWRTETPVFNTQHLLFYFRLLADGRFLFGGRGGTVGTPGESDRYRQHLLQQFHRLFPAWREIEISHFWNGLVCSSASLTPHLGSFAEDPTVFYALAYHGNGVAAATWSGRAIAHLMTDRLDLAAISAVYRQPLRAFPLPFLRLWYLRSAYVLYGLQDALP